MSSMEPMLLLFLFLSPFLRAAPGEAASASASASASAFFIDAASHPYLRVPPDTQASSMSVDEIAATVSVLLGFAPPTSLAANSSSKLNQLLLPKPFDRPGAVFLLQVDGSDDASLSIGSFNSKAGNVVKTTVAAASNAEIEIADKDDIIVIRSDESLAIACDSVCLNNELINLANWLGGSYEPTDGTLSLPLESGRSLNLQAGKEADLEFASSLVSLLKTTKKGIQIHEDFSGGILRPAELLVCHFTGVKALEDEYGSADIVRQGMQVYQRALARSFDLLQGAYEGKLVGLVIYTKEALPESGIMIDVTSSSRISRWLEEAIPTDMKVAEVVLVRKSLAWITGIILLVSTLIGVCLLMNMPLTRDTLLYSNVKLD